MITFNPSQYSGYESSDLGNIRFYYGNTTLYSWCESGCSNSSSTSVFWIKLPAQIPGGGGSIQVNMTFMPVGTEYDGVYAGEAPQLSPRYAEFDNGANVFTGYWNFEGTSLPSGFTGRTHGDATYTVDDGVTFIGDGFVTDAGIVTTSQYSNLVADVGGISVSNGGDINLELTKTDQVPTYNPQNGGYPDAYLVGTGSTNPGSVTLSYIDNVNNAFPTPCSESASQAGVLSLYWNASPMQYYGAGYQNSKCSAANVSYAPYYIGVYTGWAPTPDSSFHWLRTRAYPPGGVMPNASLGGIVGSPSTSTSASTTTSTATTTSTTTASTASTTIAQSVYSPPGQALDSWSSDGINVDMYNDPNAGLTFVLSGSGLSAGDRVHAQIIVISNCYSWSQGPIPYAWANLNFTAGSSNINGYYAAPNQTVFVWNHPAFNQYITGSEPNTCSAYNEIGGAFIHNSLGILFNDTANGHQIQI